MAKVIITLIAILMLLPIELPVPSDSDPLPTGVVGVYNGIVINTDRRDIHIVEFIDSMLPQDRRELAAIRKRQGDLVLLWGRYVPSKYFSGNAIRFKKHTWRIVASHVSKEGMPS